MTNKSSRQSNGSAPQAQRHLRTLDISFHSPNNGLQPAANNGFRPHGGYRGTNNYPISQYTYNKEYKKHLRDDLDQLFGADSFESLTSPGYAINTSKDVTHSGESPLFENRLLAPSRLEQQFSPEDYVQNVVRSQKKSKRPSSGVQYYRPESPHQYLQASGRSSTASSINGDTSESKLGRPTRTTLLRARHQRCNSAPVNMYKMRQEKMKQYEQKQEIRKSVNAPLTVRDLLGVGLPQGESVHSFLIGARYNSAHCLDSKSITTHGVYMPRGNPLGCFVVKERNLETESDGVPAAPPDTPANNSDNEDNDPPPSPINKQAWSDEVPQFVDKRKAAKCTNIPIMQQIMNVDDGLNVHGASANNRSKYRQSTNRPPSARVPTGGGNRPNSARGSIGNDGKINSTRSSTNKGPGPFVLIQGTSCRRSARAAAEYRDHFPVTSPPSSPSHKGKNSQNVHHNISRPQSSRRQTSRQYTEGETFVKVSVPFVAPAEIPTEEITPRQNDTEVMEKTEVIEKNEPEVNVRETLEEEIDDVEEEQEVSHVNEEVLSEVEISVDVQLPDNQSHIPEPELSPSQSAEQLESKLEGDEKYINNEEMLPPTKRVSRVRFSDEITELVAPQDDVIENDDTKETNKTQLGQGDNAIFFITEDGADPNKDYTMKQDEKDGVGDIEESNNVKNGEISSTMTSNIGQVTGDVDHEPEKDDGSPRLTKDDIVPKSDSQQTEDTCIL